MTALGITLEWRNCRISNLRPRMKLTIPGILHKPGQASFDGARTIVDDDYRCALHVDIEGHARVGELLPEKGVAAGGLGA